MILYNQIFLDPLWCSKSKSQDIQDTQEILIKKEFIKELAKKISIPVLRVLTEKIHKKRQEKIQRCQRRVHELMTQLALAENLEAKAIKRIQLARHRYEYAKKIYTVYFPSVYSAASLLDKLDIKYNWIQYKNGPLKTAFNQLKQAIQAGNDILKKVPSSSYGLGAGVSIYRSEKIRRELQNEKKYLAVLLKHCKDCPIEFDKLDLDINFLERFIIYIIEGGVLLDDVRDLFCADKIDIDCFLYFIHSLSVLIELAKQSENCAYENMPEEAKQAIKNGKEIEYILKIMQEHGQSKFVLCELECLIKNIREKNCNAVCTTSNHADDLSELRKTLR
jgi:hypothetical protein